nr:formate dehydrogenase accessory sulfurtransferase FdhD [Rhizobiaceae bacterium]
FDTLARRGGRFVASARELAAETAVAISFNGSSHAVLMATPADLEDLARGFALSEGIAASLAEIEAIAIVEGDRGVDAQVRLTADAAEALAKRRRVMAGPVGCGMCGLESIEAAMRTLRSVSAPVRLSARDIADAAAAMTAAQTLNRRTHAVHAAGWFVAGEGLVSIREDVGRHNALDKLTGALALAGRHAGDGAFVVSSRLSIELVQKAAVAGCGVLIAVSAPTALAVETAERANITLVAVARDSEFEIFTHPQRIEQGALSRVA